MEDLFPYENVRDSQKEFKDIVEKALKEGKEVVSHAPTGIGKTAATVAPSLSHALENGKKAFFVTPRHSQHEIVVETLREIREKHGKDFVSVDLIGKKWLCDGERGGQVFVEDEDEESCPRHSKTYKNDYELTNLAQEKVEELKNQILRAEEVRDKCDKVCPYAVLRHMVADADIVVGDYFHVFHPGVRDSVFAKAGISLSDCIVIVDEAHNLPDRTRKLNSASITGNMVGNAIDEAERKGFYNVESKLEKLKSSLRDMVKNELGMEKEVKIDKKDFINLVKDIHDYSDFIGDLESVAKEIRDEGGNSSSEAVAYFLERWKGQDHGFVRVLKRTGQKNNAFRLSYTCLDPQYSTRQPMNSSHCSILMSGTLTPVSMYREVLGLEASDTFEEVFESPFPDSNLLNLVVDRVTTRYKKRNKEQYRKIAWFISQSVEKVDGNCGVFFPSYSMRDSVNKILKDQLDCPVFLEERGMTKTEKRELLERFDSEKGSGAALLGVVGGSFGEGVDFPGDLMRSVLIVGLPLQKPDLETKALIEFYDDKFGRGWDYGYNFPAINRALQAAGRCIRSKDDRGVVVFMDERYRWSKYSKALNFDNLRVTKAPWKDIEMFFGN
ncbi:MAG: ATP-dependent DNA helicase [Candidatus Nanohaloarchaea archaeon]|nr:ATP-dependent DNA helicase [Candidatus Nanohaloarchaea archaeon]